MLQKITHQQITDRFNTLSERLKDAILSSNTTDEVWRIAQHEHLSDEKIYKLCRIVGRVMLGFIDTEDSTKEIKEYVGIPMEVAAIIQRELKRKIFSYYDTDIAKAYTPTEEIPEQKEEVRIAPRTTQAPTSTPSPMGTAKIPSSVPFATAPAPLSRIVPSQTPTPTPAGTITSHTPSPTSPSAPFVLHKEEPVQSISHAKPIEFSFPLPEAKKEAERHMVSAELELGREAGATTSGKKEPAIARTEPSQRVVHYSDFRTPVNPFEKKTEATKTPFPAAPSYIGASTNTTPAPTTAVPTPKAPLVAAPAPEQVIKPTATVQVGGNVVNLGQK